MSSNQGNNPATVSEKLRALKRLFQMAVERKQLNENPLKYIKQPKWSKREIEIYATDECEQIPKDSRKRKTPVIRINRPCRDRNECRIWKRFGTHLAHACFFGQIRIDTCLGSCYITAT